MAKRKRKITTTFIEVPNMGIDRDFVEKARQVILHYMPNWNYDLKLDPNKHYFVGLSGGADSSALGLVMAIMHPEANWVGVACDTGNEPDDFIRIVELLCTKLGMKVIIAKPEKDLFQQIKENGYLPSSLQRWCTKKLKIDTFNDYLADVLSNPDSIAVNAAGVRYDERDRAGLLGIDRVESIHPFVDQKIVRQQVMKVAAEMDVLSATYMRGKSRSGCLNCFFQSKQELISLGIWDRKHFELGSSVEKLSPTINELLDDSEHPLKVDMYYDRFPMPSMLAKGKGTLYSEDLFGDKSRTDDFGVNWDYLTKALRKPKRICRKKSHEDQLSVFDMLEINTQDAESLNIPTHENSVAKLPKFWERKHYVDDEVNSNNYIDLYVAVEVMVHPLTMWSRMYGGYSHQIITYSTTQGGLTRSVRGYMYHRQMVGDAYFYDVEQYDDQSHIICLQLRFPKELLPKPDYDEDGVYTWSSGVSYKEIDFTLRAIHRLCNHLYNKQLIEWAESEGQRTREVSLAKANVAKVESLNLELGELVSLGHFRTNFNDQDTLRDDSYDENLKTSRCIVCSL
ncbi:phosphoadenosine phosphosulfate reductase family protein [Vibrio crassostreae]|uniref:phosphoadenosine phosphosulfate reductase domain-containing protein n=1 Tax=Vibrio crassostreae TaxID=246167 RepID=UPI001B315F6A|nr:phosphoadenosine phosphosulfate reductase family protein [Vibrio crassostreae]